MSQLVNSRMPHDVYIGCGCEDFPESKWANPWERDRLHGIVKYKKRLIADRNLFNSLSELRDKTIGCNCIGTEAEDCCHGRVLLGWLDCLERGII